MCCEITQPCKWTIEFNRTRVICVIFQSGGFCDVPRVLITDARSFQALAAILDWLTHLDSISLLSRGVTAVFSKATRFYSFTVEESLICYLFVFDDSFFFNSRHVLDSLNRTYAMTLLPLACEPLEYLRGRFSSHEKQQDRVWCNKQPANISNFSLPWYPVVFSIEKSVCKSYWDRELPWVGCGYHSGSNSHNNAIYLSELPFWQIGPQRVLVN